MEFLLNPWVISFIVIAVMVGNLAALKHLSNIRLKQLDKNSDLEKLIELDKKLHPATREDAQTDTDNEQQDKT
ncbi:DUF2897 family protein [Vibrio cholerae]|uniref:DUF2897 family protein n=1 Tax=Vibrio paracholerae TaxID=650003 RepID=UPI000D3868B9|nr:MULTISPECIES: DUF2897 family protein [Vibrio]MBN7277744.1 DUF2897 family protein [Vibrio paracholerae]MBN7281197.1 DUF2897 family protein [Vibrio paracholerae]PUA72714.1 DUF2897 domain-containing protein [Vibrio cholerae]